jgi:hypothetical protein
MRIFREIHMGYELKYKSMILSLTNYIIPAQELEILQDRIIVITGVARSGTTILGKLVGSMKPAYYFYEPAIMKYLPFLCYSNPKLDHIYNGLFRSMLIEDYLLPVAQGRNLNLNMGEDSYVGHYLPLDEVKMNWQTPSRRKIVVAQLRKERPWWVIKTTGYQHLFAVTRVAMPGVRFLHIIRNGNDVVSSALKRGWYTDQYMNREIVDWAQLPEKNNGCNLPWYLDGESKECFSTWNQATRAASIWRCLTEVGMAECQAHPEDCQQLTYEDLVRQPRERVDSFNQLYGLEPTELTQKHIASVGSHKPSIYPSVLSEVQNPERDKFADLMHKLNYKIDG